MKLHSYTITQGRNRAPARAMLKAIGFTDEDLKKPIIGVANTWIETMPCNFNLRELAEHVKAGVRAAGGTPMEFNTVAISDGVTMGTEGMKASLVSRDLIADSIELVARGRMFDGIVALVDPRKHQVAFRCGQVAVDAVRADRKPRDVATRKAFENAIAAVAASGGSTNSVLHLLAMAREAGVDLSLEDFQTISSRTPL